MQILSEIEIKGNPSAEKPLILVGEGVISKKLDIKCSDLSPGGLVINAKDNVLAFLGTDEHTPSDRNGTIYAVIIFLEKYLGVRYLWPGELGKVVPKKSTIAIPEIDFRYSPRLAQRRVRNLIYNDRIQIGLNRLNITKNEYLNTRMAIDKTMAESGNWFNWHRLGGNLNIATGHAFGQLWGKYGKEHPEWFALQFNGTRDQSKDPERARLCKSNMELIATISREKIEELNQNTSLRGVSIGPNDGGKNSFCTCPNCEALDDPMGRKISVWDYSCIVPRRYEHVSLTDRMMFFWNKIAENVSQVYPDKLLVIDAYNAYSAPPILRKPHPNLVVRFASLDYENEKDRQQSLLDWEGWSRLTKHILFRPNLMYIGSRDGLPLLYTNKFKDDFSYLLNNKIIGTDFDACVHHWSTQGLNYYVIARLLWDPNLKLDDIINDYCEKGFGSAAKCIKNYFARLENITNDIVSKKESPLDHFNSNVVNELRKDLTTARHEARGDNDVIKRIEFLELGLRWTEMQHNLYFILSKTNHVVKSNYIKEQEKRIEFMRKIVHKSIYAINVAYIAWSEGGKWDNVVNKSVD